MSRVHPLVPLGEILQLQRRWIKLNPTQMYTEIGIRSFGKGIFHKTPVLGASLGNKRVLEIHPGDIVFSNVFAWEGAVGVASQAEAGKIGSHRFVTYTPISDKCDLEYLRLFFCSEAGLEVLRRVSPGSAGRNRTLNIAQFAKQLIPLPPLEEQQRIVGRFKELAVKIEEARSLRQKVLDTRLPYLREALFSQVFQGKILPHHQDEEPASKLLAKINALKERLIGEKKIPNKNKFLLL
jgi:restriction endonuclease S subunit